MEVRPVTASLILLVSASSRRFSIRRDLLSPSLAVSSLFAFLTPPPFSSCESPRFRQKNFLTFWSNSEPASILLHLVVLVTQQVLEPLILLVLLLELLLAALRTRDTDLYLSSPLVAASLSSSSSAIMSSISFSENPILLRDLV